MDKYTNKREMVDRIVDEVKSHGLFDEFRRECMADVDTKPAYQNLRVRVETSVQAFLQEQKRMPETNKLQLREKLRRYITEKGFLETGVERIVDQAVNPKINTILLPKIEDLSYKIMNVEKPKERRIRAIKVDTSQLGFLPNLDLEQVSPDSSSKSPSDEMNAVKEELQLDDKTIDDFESPAFEPVEGYKANDVVVEDTSVDMDIESNDTDDETKVEECTAVGDGPPRDSLHNDDAKSNLSSISGLTSNGSINGEEVVGDGNEAVAETISSDTNAKHDEQLPDIETETISTEITMEEVTVAAADSSTVAVPADSGSKTESHAECRNTVDVNQDSALSRISNNSPLTMHIDTKSQLADDENADNADSIGVNISGDGIAVENSIRDMSLCDIDEEAQMQKFNDSSSSNNSSNVEKANGSACSTASDQPEVIKPVTSFDINKDEIKFEGPERKAFADFSLPKDDAIDNEKTADECLTPTSSKFEPSSFNVKPVEVSCADLNVDDVRTSISDCFETNSSQSNSNNLVIIENQDDDVTAKSMDVPASLSVSPTTNESSITPPTDEKRSSREASAEHKRDSSRSKEHKHSSSSRSSHTDRDRNKERPGSSVSASKERSSSSRDKYRKPSTSHSSSSRKRSRSRDRTKDKERSKASSHESSSRRHDSSSTSSKDKSSHHKSSRPDRDSSRTSESDRSKDKSTSSRSKSSSGHNRSHHSDKRDDKRSDDKRSDDKRDDRHRSDSRKSSSRKEDDHAIHRSKPSSRQRSRSKDSNDGSTQPGNNNASDNLNGSTHQTNSAKESKSDDSSTHNNNDGTVPIDDAQSMDSEEPSPGAYSPVGVVVHHQEPDTFVPPTKPIVVEQFLSSDASVASGNSGMELVFVCDDGGDSEPRVISPVKTNKNVSTSPTADTNHTPDDFHGFVENDIPNALLKLSAYDRCQETQIITCAKPKATAQKRSHATPNASAVSVKKARARSNTWATPTTNESRSQHINMDFGMKNPELFLAKVIISKSNSSSHVKLKSTNVHGMTNDDIIGVSKAKPKMHYSNDELYKPRPFIGGSRSRRRDANCDELT